jgi:hypothetical protein
MLAARLRGYAAPARHPSRGLPSRSSRFGVSSCEAKDGGPDFPQMEPTDQVDAPNRRLPESRVERFAEAATNHEMGVKSMISGPFFISSLVGVGCRVVVPRPRLGTLRAHCLDD